MSSVIFDAELCGENMPLDMVMVFHKSMPNTPFPIKHFLESASNDLSWHEPWIELRSQKDGSKLYAAGYRKTGHKWELIASRGEVPDRGTRVDLYVYQNEPKVTLDSLLESPVM